MFSRIQRLAHWQAWALNRNVGTLVIAEVNGPKVAPSTLNTITAATQLTGPLDVLVAGKGVQPAAEQISKVAGVNNVQVADDAGLDKGLAETHAALALALHQRQSYDHILAPSSTYGKALLPRLAALLDTQPLSDVVQIIDGKKFVRPIYAGNAISTVEFKGNNPCMMTIRTTNFEAAKANAASPAAVQSMPSDEVAAAAAANLGVEWISEERRASERPELGAAQVVVSGGRALKTAENFQMLERIADILGGAVGATRAAVDAGMVPNDLQVGQTGKVVAPKLYIALGISGAIQHLAGMKDSKTIVAINTDADADIFKVADYGLVMDIFEALPQLEEELKKAKA